MPRIPLVTEASMTDAQRHEATAGLAHLEKSDEMRVLAEAVDRGPETLRALAVRFPGKLRVDRFAVTGRPLPAAQYSGLLELVIRMGSAASELLIEKLGSAQRDIRFYAAVCIAELRPRDAVFALAERLFDQDYGVRQSAIEATPSESSVSTAIRNLDAGLARI